MAFLSRYCNNPLETGYIIQLHKLCGKKNCRCFTQGKKHISYALKYWEYDYATQSRKQRIKYLKKSQVAETQRQLAIKKGEQLLFFKDEYIFPIYNNYNHLDKEDMYIQAYLLFGNSINAQKWLNGRF